MSLGIVFLSEVFGTCMLTLLGCGVVANVALRGTKGSNGGFLVVTGGWGIAGFAGVFVAAKSGVHLKASALSRWCWQSSPSSARPQALAPSPWRCSSSDRCCHRRSDDGNVHIIVTAAA